MLFFKHFHFFIRKVNLGQNQNEAIASSCLMGIGLDRGRVSKPDKVLCCMFLFGFFGLDRAQNAVVVYSVLRNLPTEAFRST